MKLRTFLAILLLTVCQVATAQVINGLNYTTYRPADGNWVSPDRNTLTQLTTGTVTNIYNDWDYVLDSGRNNGVVVKFTGYFKADTAGTYNLGLEGDDGVELIMKGQTVISHWADQPGTRRTGTITLAAGEVVPVTIWFYENGGGARLRFLQEVNSSWVAVPTISLATSLTLWNPPSCNPCSPNTNNANLGFESGSTTNWLISNGTGTAKAATGWNSNGVGVNTTTGITNYSPGGGKTWNVTPYGSYMMAIQAGSGSPNFDPSMTSLGLTSTEISNIRTYLTSLGGNSSPTNASWAKRTVTLQAGVTYTVAWQYMSTDYVPFNDGSAMTLVHSTDATKVPTLNNEVKRYALLGFTNPGTGNYATNSYGSTGWQLATITVPADGDYILGFSSFNLGDTALSPILLVDDLQGATTLNGTAFNPIPPNEGSTAPTAGPVAPTLCCGGSSAPFTADPAKILKVQSFVNRTTADSIVYIEQIGNQNTITVNQTGTKNNFVDYFSNGSLNNVNIQQSGNSSTTANYLEVDLGTSTSASNSNTVNITQTSTGGTKSAFINVTDSNNTVNVQQKDSGSHWLDLTLSGGNKNATVIQQGAGNHQAQINLGGTATTLDLTQSGATAQSYSINHTCATAGGCGTITVTQGQ